MDELNKIGFYSLYDERVKTSSATSQMKRCEMIITEYCNFNCPYCRHLSSEIYGDRKIKQLSFSEIKTNIDYWCDGIPLENIRFSGGEPTLHKDICEVVAYAKEKGIKRIAISSNGYSDLALYKELVRLGANDFSISLDGCCSETVDKMAGGVKGAFDIISNNIKELSKLTYVTVGVVLTPENIEHTLDTIKFADSLGVSDIRLISAAQWNGAIEAFKNIDPKLLAKYPILNYRSQNFANGVNVRGMAETDARHCGLIMDDSVIAGSFHFPCIIAMREGAKPIGRVGPNMRQERVEWYKNHDCLKDDICKTNCLDVCIKYNNKFKECRGEPEEQAHTHGRERRHLPVIL